MFCLFTYKKLCILSAVICVLLICVSVFNGVAPAVNASARTVVRVPVIMYHHICNRESLWCDYVIPDSLLNEDFEYFKENGITPVSFKSIQDFIKKDEPLPQKPIVITFDDGQRSFLTKALPLLEEYNYPANVNIVGSLVELYTQNGETNDNYAYLNRSDIELLDKNPLVELGCHTYNYHSLGKRHGIGKRDDESDEQYAELVADDIKSFNTLFGSMIKKSVFIYAYPYGIRNDIALEEIKKQGFTVTLTCREEVNYINKDSSLYELGRFNRPYGISSEEFFEDLF